MVDKCIETPHRGDWRKEIGNIEKVVMQEWKMKDKVSMIMNMRAIRVIKLNITADAEWF